MLQVCYASTFKHRRQYVWGCPPVTPSVHLSEAWNTIFPPIHGSVVPSDNHDRFAAHPSVRQEMFPGISRKTHGENGLKFCMLIYPDYPQNWLDLGRALLILLIFVPLWLSETGHIWGLRALHGEHLGVNVKGARRHISDAMRRVLSIFSRSGAIMRLSQCIWGGNL